MLLSHHADVNARSSQGRTALHVCLSSTQLPPTDQQKQLAEKLLKTTDLKLTDNKGYGTIVL